MALLLETTLGDVVVDLDVEGSPVLCRNVLKLAKARYYTNVLFHNVQPHRFCRTGDPTGTGRGGACIQALLECQNQDNNIILNHPKRFLKSTGRTLTEDECREKGRVVATELDGIPDTIGSQFLITLAAGPDRALDGYRMVVATTTTTTTDTTNESQQKYLSLGQVTEDDSNVLERMQRAYCDASGRPYADIRIVRALVLHDPFDDPPGMDDLLTRRGVILEKVDGLSTTTTTASPNYPKPPEETVEARISAHDIDDMDEDEENEQQRQQQEEMQQREDRSRAVVLEMLGDLPSAEIKAPENVLFVCKLNPITEDEDLELIFSRFDPDCRAEIIRDGATGASLQYAFVKFTNKQQCVEAYFKMNNTLIDDRRIKVDFSQSVAKIWDKYAQRMRGQQQHPQKEDVGKKHTGGHENSSRGGRGVRGPPRSHVPHSQSEYQRRDPNGHHHDRGRRGPPPSNRSGEERRRRMDADPMGHEHDDRHQHRSHRYSPGGGGRRRSPDSDHHRAYRDRRDRSRSPDRERSRRHPSHHHGDERRRRRSPSRSVSSDTRERKRRKKEHKRRRHGNRRDRRHRSEDVDDRRRLDDNDPSKEEEERLNHLRHRRREDRHPSRNEDGQQQRHRDADNDRSRRSNRESRERDHYDGHHRDDDDDGERHKDRRRKHHHHHHRHDKRYRRSPSRSRSGSRSRSNHCGGGSD